MFDMCSLLKEKQIKKTPKTSERSLNIEELYKLYTSVTERKLRRIENWKRYRLWLMNNRIPHSPENVTKFRKVKTGVNKFIDEYGISSFAFMTSHIKTSDLYYVLSVARDKNHREQSIGAWLFAKPK